MCGKERKVWPEMEKVSWKSFRMKMKLVESGEGKEGPDNVNQ